MAAEPRPIRPRRLALAAAVPVLLLVGLFGRFALPDDTGDFIGGVAYTAFVYVLIALLAPGLRPTTVGIAAFGCSAAVELFQLTGIPADLADWFSPIRLALGTAFVATDFLAYAVGAALALVIDRRFAPPAGRGDPT